GGVAGAARGGEAVVADFGVRAAHAVAAGRSGAGPGAVGVADAARGGEAIVAGLGADTQPVTADRGAARGRARAGPARLEDAGARAAVAARHVAVVALLAPRNDDPVSAHRRADRGLPRASPAVLALAR